MLRIPIVAAAMIAGTTFSAATPRGPAVDAHYNYAAGQPVKGKWKSTPVAVVYSEKDGKLEITPGQLKFKQGQVVKFSIRNDTAVKHEFVLGTTTENLGHAETMRISPDLERHEVNGRVMKPSSTVELQWQFINTGKFEFACLVPGHAEKEIRGEVIVE
ncbi:copper resistance protein [Rhodopseudomonas boonkerdii]|uniref:cupredoxin domain-containing protein n=1 Tax=Rhodopseudomonas boonkerdii TaxID=475937 RepID=UPI001E499D3E|nr:copper resistance protein [Rhodopseudomonas boonkerdii]UGV26979.1 copper resistance protein [Rhodopseudomonas boonkerdii]